MKLLLSLLVSLTFVNGYNASTYPYKDINDFKTLSTYKTIHEFEENYENYTYYWINKVI